MRCDEALKADPVRAQLELSRPLASLDLIVGHFYLVIVPTLHVLDLFVSREAKLDPNLRQVLPELLLDCVDLQLCSIVSLVEALDWLGHSVPLTNVLPLD